MAEYREVYDRITGAGADVAALSADEPVRAEQMRQTLRLPFSILCDPDRRVITAWGLLNPHEHGGIAIPSVFVIGADRRTEFASVDRTASRVMPENILKFLVAPSETPQAPARRPIIPGLRNIAGSVINVLRHDFRSPRSDG